MPKYTSIPYAAPSIYDNSSGTRTIVDLILEQGRARASGQLAASKAWSGAAEGLGEAGAVWARGRDEEKKRKETAAAVDAEFANWDGQDLRGLYRRLAPRVGAEPAMKLATGYASLDNVENSIDSFKLAVVALDQARQSFGDEYLADHWTELTGRVAKGARRWLDMPVPEAYSKEAGDFIGRLARQYSAKAADGYTLGPDEVRYDASNKEVARGAPSTRKPANLQSKDVLLDGKPALVSYDPTTGRYLRGEEDVTSRVGVIPPASVTVNAGRIAEEKDDERINALSIFEGRSNPQQYSKRNNAGLLAEVDRISMERTGRHFDLNKAQLDYEAARRHVLAMNSTQRVSFRALAQSVLSTMDEVKAAAEELKQGDVQRFNRAKRSTVLELYGNTKQSAAAVRYIAAVNTLKEEYANLAQGGFAPTESAWKLANEQINGDFGVRDMVASVEETGRLIGYRVDAFERLGPSYIGGAAGQAGAPPPGGPPAAAGPVMPANVKASHPDYVWSEALGAWVPPSMAR